MARAKRHYIPGYIWHITHRCHKREFLLKFSKDRHRYVQQRVKQFLGIRAKGRDVVEGGQGYQLREGAADYKPLLEDENEDIGLENAYVWDLNGG
jgi:hypothetical protein